MTMMRAQATPGDHAKRPLSTVLPIALACCLPLLLAACTSDDHGDLARYVEQVKARKTGRIATLPEFQTYESYTYNVKGLRDPFEPTKDRGPSQSAEIGTGLHPDLNRHKEALESFPLDSLAFVGHLEQHGRQWAIVSAPDHLVYRVQVGNHIGQNHGKIIGITESRLQIEELVKNPLGAWIEREAALTISE